MTVPTKIFRLSYPADAFRSLYVERPADISREELLSSITKEEISASQDDGVDPRHSFEKNVNDHNYSLILDEDGEEAVFN